MSNNAATADMRRSVAQGLARAILAFEESGARSAWVWSPGQEAKIYVRNANRLLAGAMHRTLDLASIEVEAEFRSQGIFTELLCELEARASHTLYIENVLNPDLRSFLARRHGWIALPSTGMGLGVCDSFFFRAIAAGDLRR